MSETVLPADDPAWRIRWFFVSTPASSDVWHHKGAPPTELCRRILVLVIAAIDGGYGMQNELPQPHFIRAFYSYFGPSILVTVIELVRRLDRQLNLMGAKGIAKQA